MTNELGIYNKYIYNNNSYLSLYIIKETYKNNKNKKNLYDIIDLNLKLKTIKNKAYKLSQIKKLNEKSNDNIFYKLE